MEVVLTILKVYFICTVLLMLIYAVRHAVFSYNRMFGRQRMYYSDIYDSDMPTVSILIPMHNEEKVLSYVLDSLLNCTYDRDRLEIIPINDNSSDRTAELLEEYRCV